MAYQHQGSCASAGDTLELLAFDDEFDPLAVDDSEIDQEWMDDENPYDTIDYPTMRNMPETVHHDPVYSPARQGSATEALQALIVRNPNRRPVLLNIIGLCENGCASSVISEKVDEWQRDNWSVYAPMTLCRMLERAGALVLEMPEVTDEHESVEEGVSYLEIRETVDPVWRSTPEALALREEYLAGKSFRAVVLGSDEARYAELCAKQRAFFDEHLANWVPRLCADVRAYAQTAFYRGVADITEGFLQLEDQMIGQSAQAA